MPSSLEEEARGEAMTSQCMGQNSLAVEEPITAHMVSSFEMEEFCNLGDASGDEAILALIDTACTACMHSMNWRLAFSKQLPDSVRCEPLQQFKTFHFANGSSTASQIQVWKIPICLGGRPGEVHSAEVPEGNTPLLLSISALESLDAIIYMKQKCMKLQELGVTLPLKSTRTRHLAIDVSFANLEFEVPRTEVSRPLLKSEADDLHVFWTEEAKESILQEFALLQSHDTASFEDEFRPKVGPRGVTVKDRRRTLHAARFEALQHAAISQKVLDAQMWVALRRNYTKAEEFVTHGFHSTMIFEPWRGTFPVTRLASLSRGWVNSQPMDIKDGVDLLSDAGQKLIWQTLDEHDPYLTLIAFDCRLWTTLTNLSQHIDWNRLRETVGKKTLKLVFDIAMHRHRRGKYYLLENPQGALSWIFQGILMRLLEEAAGKFVEGDQCRYGKIDEESKKPVKKRTGWLGNNEYVLNRLGKQCNCPRGSHDPIIGGSRSKAAAVYPKQLCEEILLGIEDSMIADYVLYKERRHEEAFPVEVKSSAGEQPSEPSNEEFRELMDLLEEPAGPDEQGAGAPSAPSIPAPATPSNVLRRRPRVQEVKKGAWQNVSDADVLEVLRRTLTWTLETGAVDWAVLDLQHDLARQLGEQEAGQTDLKLILVSRLARRMKRPQPHAGPMEAPLRKALILMDNDEVISSGWEEWHKLAPTQQNRALPSRPRQLTVMMFGQDINTPAAEPQPEDESVKAKWERVPRELRLAIRRVHVNLGHARLPDMLRALRISRASEAAIRATRLFRCPECPRLAEPKLPRPSKLPTVDEFGVIVGMDVIEVKDSDQVSWSMLNCLDLGTTYQVVVLLDQSVRNPTSAEIADAFNQGWASWAGLPERGVVLDQAKYFMTEFARRLEEQGCEVSVAAKASPWHLAAVERHGGTWKTIWRKLVWSQQISGRSEVLQAVAETNKARNSLARRSGFSPEQWVLGRSIRLPADLLDDAEVARVGAQAAALTPTTRFHRQVQLRTAAREACIKASNSEALRRAELRRVRPSRGPFPVGSYVFYYDKPVGDSKHGPHNWRGIARVIGHDSSHTVWLSHRGILVAASPEHLSLADDLEVRGWMITSKETELLDATPAVTSNTFLDIRRKDVPPLEGFEEQPDEKDADEEQPPPMQLQKVPEEEEMPAEDVKIPDYESEGYSPSEAPVERETEEKDESPKSRKKREEFELGMKRSEAARKRMVRSSVFFKAKEDERKLKKTLSLKSFPYTESVRTSEVAELPNLDQDEELPPIPMQDFDPDIDPFMQAVPTEGAPPIETRTARGEAEERAAKRLRVTSPARAGSPQNREAALFLHAEDVSEVMRTEAEKQYALKSDFYQAADVSFEDFLFGVERNLFDYQIHELQESAFATSGKQQFDAAKAAKKGRKEIRLGDLEVKLQQEFTGENGSDKTEWQGWLDKKACEVLSVEESERVRRNNPELIVPTRWVRTNKNEGIADADFKAKSRLVVQGFKDKALGRYRRDAPTASQIAESILLCITAFYHFILICKDVKNGYFCGKPLEREVYLEQPRGGLPGLKPGQLLRAKKAIYGFAEAARLFWLALREHLLSDGWVESSLEPALFYHRSPEGVLNGILVTHVDDLEGGIRPGMEEKLFRLSSQSLDFATSHRLSFTFRGREVKQSEKRNADGNVRGGHIDVCMRNYALSMSKIAVSKERRTQVDADLTEEEQRVLNSGAGELGWIARQLRSDLAFDNGCIQRCKKQPKVSDLLKLKTAIEAARRGADVRLRFWDDVDLEKGVILHLADSGHANGTPEHDEIQRYRSIGGYYILIANPEVLEGKAVRANLLAFNSSQTKRVCRSTLAAEASHLSESIECGDWINSCFA